MIGIAEIVVFMAMLIPVVGVVSWGVQRLGRLRLEEARLRAGLDDESLGELHALREEVSDLRQDLDQLQERVDFTERALAQTREPRRLPEGS